VRTEVRTDATGWLSGWPRGAEGQPDEYYAIPADGSLPLPVGSPPVARIVCFEGTFGGSGACLSPTPV
jgi:hypothetical protein